MLTVGVNRSGMRLSRASFAGKGRIVRVRADDKARAPHADPGSSEPGPTDSMEELFAKETQRRKIRVEDPPRPDPFSSTRTSAPRWASEEIPQQLQKSRDLNSEGLEGFIPRAEQLLKLAFTFSLYFAPVALVTSLLFLGVFSVFGDKFVHQGDSSMKIPYVDPTELLQEDPYYPMVPILPPSEFRD